MVHGEGDAFALNKHLVGPAGVAGSQHPVEKASFKKVLT
jgi:hypothetical protein